MHSDRLNLGSFDFNEEGISGYFDEIKRRKCQIQAKRYFANPFDLSDRRYLYFEVARYPS